MNRRERLRARVRRHSGNSPFHVGNAGDIYARDLIRMVYGLSCVNVSTEGRRLLLIGSIAHVIRDGDVVCGIGTKGVPLPPARHVQCHVTAVRGPLTLEAFRAAGHDVSNVRSLLDPGLLIRFSLEEKPPRRGRRVLIPHYRERAHYRKRHARRGLTFVNIDATPLDFAREIRAAEIVYTSSLHGLIFAHALRRPAVLIEPLTEEPEIKYRDYFASIGVPWRRLPSLDEALRAKAPDHAPDLRYAVSDFGLPTVAELEGAGILEATVG